MVCHDGNVFDTFWVQTSFTRYQKVSVSCVASVFQTSGRRFANVLDVSGLSHRTRVLHVVGRNVFFTRYQNVSVSGVASVFKTSGRRFVNVLDVSDL